MDDCPNTSDGRHTWVNNSPGNGSDCSSCGATTAFPVSR